MTRWEYRGLQRNSANLNGLINDLNALGRDGWEVIGFASADKTLGLNSIMAILKRPIDEDARGRAPGRLPMSAPTTAPADRRPAVGEDLPEGTHLTEIGARLWAIMAGEQHPLSFDALASLAEVDLVAVSETMKELEESGFTQRQRGGVYIATVPQPDGSR